MRCLRFHKSIFCFDEACRPIEIRFHITSDVAQQDRITYLEQQLNQKFEYTTREVVENAFSDVEDEIAQIKPFEEVEVIDYIDELSNVVKVTDEHFLLVLTGADGRVDGPCGVGQKSCVCVSGGGR